MKSLGHIAAPSKNGVDTNSKDCFVLLGTARHRKLLKIASSLAREIRSIKDNTQRNLFGKELSLLNNQIVGFNLAGLAPTFEIKSLEERKERCQISILRELEEIKESLDRLSKKIEATDKMVIKKKPHQSTIALDKDGCLHYEGRSYQLKTSCKRVKTLYYLAIEPDYIKTSRLSEITGYNKKCLRTTISEINRISRNNLRLDPKNGDIIIGQSGRGYKINDNYFIDF